MLIPVFFVVPVTKRKAESVKLVNGSKYIRYWKAFRGAGCSAI